MNRKLVYLIAICIIFASCGTEKLKKDIKEKYPDGSTKTEAYYKYRIEGKDTIRTEMTKQISYFENGKKQIEGTYKDGKMDGYWVAYYSDGKKQSEGDFKEGLGTGKRTVYFENGKIRYIGYYEKGIPTKKWEIYDNTGKKLKEVTYENGKIVKETSF